MVCPFISNKSVQPQVDGENDYRWKHIHEGKVGHCSVPKLYTPLHHPQSLVPTPSCYCCYWDRLCQLLWRLLCEQSTEHDAGVSTGVQEWGPSFQKRNKSGLRTMALHRDLEHEAPTAGWGQQAGVRENINSIADVRNLKEPPCCHNTNVLNLRK